MGTATETEAKLAAFAGFRLPELGGVLDGVSAVPLPERRLDALYYDTADLRLARSDITVRHRTGDRQHADSGEWTVKLPAGRSGLALVRREVTVVAPAGVVPELVVSLVRAVVRSALLVPAVRLRTRRQPIELRAADGTRLAEVVDDEVSVMDGSHLAARFRELEVELAGGAPDDLLTAVAERLRAGGAGEAGTAPKMVQALGPRATAPPDVVVPDLTRRATMADVVRAAVATGTTRLMGHDPGVRLGDDPEDVHQARVAVRRLRSDLRTFRRVLDPGPAQALADDLRTLGQRLGAVRDADVLLGRLEDHVARLDGADPAAAAGLLGRLRTEREDARTALLATLDGDDYLTLLDTLVAAAAAPSCLPVAGDRASGVLADVVRRPWVQLRRAVEALDDEPPDEALHAVRIRAKGGRYAAEAAAPVLGRPARRLARALAGLQEVLGDLNDAVVAEAWLARQEDLPPDQARVAEELAGVQRASAEADRQAWRGAWETAAGVWRKSWRR